MRPADARAWAAGALLAVGLAPVAAHQPITSKYTYNEHVYPVVRDYCGRCHFPGGPTPMSLLTHADAAPWAESIREQLAQDAMPPVFVDPAGPAVKHAVTLPARELDMLLTWAAGGTPQGDPARTPPPPPEPTAWRQGTPDLLLPVPAQTLMAGELAGERLVTLDTALTGERWVKLVDVRPGTPSMVRGVTVTTDQGVTLAAWVPGDPAQAGPSGAAFRLAAGARLQVRIRYKKHWKDEQVARTDASELGVYFTTPPVTGRALDGVDVSGRVPLARPLRVLAVRPTIDRAFAAVRIDALHDGRRVPLLHLQAARPGWDRRYWLDEPVELPAGAIIEVTADAAGEDAAPTTMPPVALDALPL